MRQKRCPSCGKKRPFDADHAKAQDGWEKVGERWLCRYCVQTIASSIRSLTERKFSPTCDVCYAMSACSTPELMFMAGVSLGIRIGQEHGHEKRHREDLCPDHRAMYERIELSRTGTIEELDEANAK